MVFGRIRSMFRFSLHTLLFAVLLIALLLTGFRIGFDRGWAAGQEKLRQESNVTRTYVVGDLVEEADRKAASLATSVDFAPLIASIEKTIDPTSWENVGGPGCIQGYAVTRSLVVTQLPAAHEEIVVLLESLRRDRLRR